MSLISIWNQINTMGSYIVSEKMTRRQFILHWKNERFIFPVTPKDYEVTSSHNNPIVDIIDFGETQLLGNPKLQTYTFSSFFPRLAHNYPFASSVANDAEECVEKIIKWKETKTPLRFIITDSNINSMVTIKSFDFKEQDTSKDIYYTLKFVEYKDSNTANFRNQRVVNKLTGLKERPFLEKPTNLEKARDILDLSKKAYGTYKKWRTLASKNNITNLAVKNIKEIMHGGKMKL